MKKKKKKKSAAGIIEQSNLMPQNPAADLETYLKSRMNDLPCRDLIRNISVSESGDGKSLNVTIVRISVEEKEKSCLGWSERVSPQS